MFKKVQSFRYKWTLILLFIGFLCEFILTTIFNSMDSSTWITYHSDYTDLRFFLPFISVLVGLLLDRRRNKQKILSQKFNYLLPFIIFASMISILIAYYEYIIDKYYNIVSDLTYYICKFSNCDSPLGSVYFNIIIMFIFPLVVLGFGLIYKSLSNLIREFSKEEFTVNKIKKKNLAKKVIIAFLLISMLPFLSECTITMGFPTVIAGIGINFNWVNLIINLVCALVFSFIFIFLFKKRLKSIPVRIGLWLVFAYHIIMLIGFFAFFGHPIITLSMIYPAVLPLIWLGISNGALNFDHYIRIIYVVSAIVYFFIGYIVSKAYLILRKRNLKLNKIKNKKED